MNNFFLKSVAIILVILHIRIMESIYKQLVNINLKLAHLLRYLRKQNNWTQEYLAEISTIDYKHIQRLESVKYISDIRFSTLLKLATAFNLNALDFLRYILLPEEM